MFTRRVLPVVALSLLTMLADDRAIAADVEAKDPEAFAKIVPADAKLERLATGMKFTEGPVWVPGEPGMLVFSDIPADEMKKWTKAEGLTTFRVPSRGANGNAIDAEGRLITCEHRSRSVVRNAIDGSMETIADAHDGRKLNSPNDAAVKSDGTVWFTDPPYGLDKRNKEQKGNYVYRLDPKTKEVRAAVYEIPWPNGIAFSPDETRLYVANSDRGTPMVFVMPIKKDGLPGTPQALCRIDKGIPDGIRCDADGRIWSSAGDGVHVFSPEGNLLGKVLVPEAPANLCFGGDDGKTLFITARTSLYAIRTNVTGAQKPKPDASGGATP